MILHLLSDDKFADYAISQFDVVAPNQNKFVIMVYSYDYSCKNIQQLDKATVIAVGTPEYKNLCSNLNNFNAIIMHNLSTNAHFEIIKKAAIDVKIAWVFWGFEVYSRNECIKRYLGAQTRSIYTKYMFKQYLKAILKRSRSGRQYARNYEIPKEIFKRVDFCLTDLKEDFEVANKYLKGNFNWLWYSYYSIEDTIGNLKDKFINGNNILIGNSASITNNYLEAFEMIIKFNMGDRKIITPLSYGEKYYANVVLKRAKEYFGENFYPLKIFMEREAYNSLLQSCSIAIMNHYRHQAMGNIITALWLGARVYLSKRATTYLYFKRLGVHLYSIEDDLNPSNEVALERLPAEYAMDNRKILNKEYSKERLLKSVEEIIETLS